MILTWTGVDPGLVDTGLVTITLNNENRSIHVMATALRNTDAETVADYLTNSQDLGAVFVEKYLDRGTTFSTHSEMREFETLLKKLVPSIVLLNNTGVKQVVKDDMLRRLHCYDFPTTRHRDLQAAARIGIYGALKDPAANSLIYQCLIDDVRGKPWQTL